MTRSIAGLAAAWLVLSLGAAHAQQGSVELQFHLEAARRALREGDATAVRVHAESILAMDASHPEGLALLQAVNPGAAASPVVPAGVDVDRVALGLAIEAAPRISPQEALRLLREDPYRSDAAELRSVVAKDVVAQAKEAEEKGQRGKAMVRFRRAAFLSPDDPLIRYEFFQALLRRDRLEESLEQAEAFLALQREGALAAEMQRQLLDVYTRLGTRSMGEQRWSQAAPFFEKVLRMAPPGTPLSDVEKSLAVCYYSLGVQEAAHDRRREACASFSHLMDLRPEEESDRERWDREYLDKLRRSALSPLWNEAKAAKSEGRFVEAYRYFGHVEVLGTQGWMVRLAEQNRKEIEDIVGPSIRYGTAVDPSLPAGDPGIAGAPPAPRAAPTLAAGPNFGVPGEGTAAPAPVSQDPAPAPPPVYSLEAALYGGVPAGATIVGEAPPAATEPGEVPPPAPAAPARWVPGSGELPAWLRTPVPAGETPDVGEPPSLEVPPPDLGYRLDP